MPKIESEFLFSQVINSQVASLAELDYYYYFLNKTKLTQSIEVRDIISLSLPSFLSNQTEYTRYNKRDAEFVHTKLSELTAN